MTSYTIFGSESSPYSIKVRAYARHLRAFPFSWANARTDPGYQAVAKLPIIPAVRCDADGVGYQDSTPIMRAWDAKFPLPEERSAHPPCVALRFISDLLEEFGDEWANKWMFHYRWARPIDQRMVALRLAHEALGGTSSKYDDEQLVGISEMIRKRMSGRGFVVGSNEITGPMIERSFRDGIAQLERHFSARSDRTFLLGSRPCFGDFGLACQIYQALIDPTAGAILRDTCPRVSAWAARVVWQNKDGDGAWETIDSLRPTLEPFIRDQVGGVFLTWMRANAECIESKRTTCKVSIPGLGMWTSACGGPQKYQLKSLKVIQAEFARAAASDCSGKLVEFMKTTNCYEVLAMNGGGTVRAKV